MDESVLEEKPSCKMLVLTFSSKLDFGSYIISIAKTCSKKIGALIRSMKFFSLRLLCISINILYAHVWNTVVRSGVLLLVAELLVLHLLLLVNPWLIIEMWPA